MCERERERRARVRERERDVPECVRERECCQPLIYCKADVYVCCQPLIYCKADVYVCCQPLIYCKADGIVVSTKQATWPHRINCQLICVFFKIKKINIE